MVEVRGGGRGHVAGLKMGLEEEAERARSRRETDCAGGASSCRAAGCPAFACPGIPRQP